MNAGHLVTLGNINSPEFPMVTMQQQYEQSKESAVFILRQESSKKITLGGQLAIIYIPLTCSGRFCYKLTVTPTPPGSTGLEQRD
jgi:hypothetical protein